MSGIDLLMLGEFSGSQGGGYEDECILGCCAVWYKLADASDVISLHLPDRRSESSCSIEELVSIVDTSLLTRDKVI